MAKSAIRVLLAASALMPTIAAARQEPQEGPHHRPDQAQREQYRAQHAQDHQPPRPDARAQVQALPHERQGEPMRPAGAPGPDRGPQPDFGPGAHGGQGGYAGRGGQDRPHWGPDTPGGQGGYAGRGTPGRPDGDQDGPGRPGYPGHRPDRPIVATPDHRGDLDAHMWHRDDPRGGDDRRGNSGWQPGRRGWDDGWRGDRRYDWNRYRYENREAFRLPRYDAPPRWGYGYRRFAIGVTLGYGLYGENYWIDDPYDYRLPPAYGPYRWVRYYDDALLVDIRTGYVVDAVYGIFW